jgi:hypothetical protein
MAGFNNYLTSYKAHLLKHVKEVFQFHQIFFDFFFVNIKSVYLPINTCGSAYNLFKSNWLIQPSNSLIKIDDSIFL